MREGFFSISPRDISLPHPLGDQMVCFAGAHHLSHQGQRFRRNAEIDEACGKTGEPQDADRVFDKSRTHMAQHPRLQIAQPAKRIDQRAIAGPRNGVDGQITARQILFQPHLRRRMKTAPA